MSLTYIVPQSPPDLAAITIQESSTKPECLASLQALCEWYKPQARIGLDLEVVYSSTKSNLIDFDDNAKPPTIESIWQWQFQRMTTVKRSVSQQQRDVVQRCPNFCWTASSSDNRIAQSNTLSNKGEARQSGRQSYYIARDSATQMARSPAQVSIKGASDIPCHEDIQNTAPVS